MNDIRNGFTRDEYFRALSTMFPADEARQMADMFVDQTPEGAIPSEGLLDALALVSPDCARRVQAIFGMTDEEWRVRCDAQAKLLTRPERVENLFSQAEVEQALAMVMPADDASRISTRIFDGTEDVAALNIRVELLDLLLLVSDDCSARIQSMFGWTNDQTAMRRQLAWRLLHRS